MVEELNDIALKVKKPGKLKLRLLTRQKTSRKEGLEAAFGLWTNRKETGESISKEIREANRKIT